MSLLTLTALSLMLQVGDSGVTEAQKAAALSAFKASSSSVVESHKQQAPPSSSCCVVVDVSEPMRSASFGHTTQVLIPKHQSGSRFQYFIVYGNSTNRPGASFGPFEAHLPPQKPKESAP